MKVDEAKTAINKRAKDSMRAYLQSMSWEEKVRSIERMNATQKVLQEAMRKAMIAEKTTADSE
jgi:hypothetical protein